MSKDDIDLEFLQQTNAYAGANETTCGNQITLSGTQSVWSGVWLEMVFCFCNIF